MSKRKTEETFDQLEENKRVKGENFQKEVSSVDKTSGYISLYDEVCQSGILDEKKGTSVRQKCYNYVDARKKKLPIHMLKAKKSLFENLEVLNESEYYFEKGLRKVRPYFYTFDTFCKERWLGKTLRELYTKEFRLYPIECYEKAAINGNLLLNLQKVKSLDVKLKNNDLISTKLHRHEGPVTSAEIKIIAENSKFLVVNKPSGMPIHPCSRYRNNTLLFILTKEFNMENIHVCHRIDLLTSGICIFAKTKDIAKTLGEEIRERSVEKEYVCKVVGEFPDKGEEGYLCDAPITNINPKLGYVVAWAIDGRPSKTAQTTFYRLSTDGETSIVLCKPKTGRTHQIRAHLQLLGFPIINDPIYNHPAWGNSRFIQGPCDRVLEEVVDQILFEWKMQTHKQTADKKVDLKKEETCKDDEIDAECFFSDCPECVDPIPDPNPSDLIMYLHALKYKGEKWMFETDMPEWANIKSSV